MPPPNHVTGDPTMDAARLSGYCSRLIAGTALVAALLAGCGSDSADPVAPDPDGGSSSTNADSSKNSSASSSAASEPAAEGSTLPVPVDGPTTTITDFPVPDGAEIVDLGPALSGNWQFGISSPDPVTTVEFYKTTLTAAGYTLRENVAVVVGENTIEYDLAFFGTTFGIVDASNVVPGTLVTVDDEPIDGVEP